LFASCLLGFVAGCPKKPDSNPPADKAGGNNDKKGGAGPAENPEFKLTGEALAKEAFADEKAATAKYKDKVVEVEAAVSSSDEKGLHLVGAKKKKEDIIGLNLFCIPVAAEKEKFWGLGKGQKVKVTGQVTGITSLAIYLDRATVKELEKSPLVTIEAEKLVSEFLADEAAAKKKYLAEDGIGYKEIVVEGTVAGSYKTPTDFNKVKLAGKGETTVDCTVAKEVMEKLKKGDKVKMKGLVAGLADDKKAVHVDAAFPLQK